MKLPHWEDKSFDEGKAEDFEIDGEVGGKFDCVLSRNFWSLVAT
jgi:hypothetical protein